MVTMSKKNCDCGESGILDLKEHNDKMHGGSNYGG